MDTKFPLPPKVRPVVLLEATGIGARIVPHKTDPTKLVLKSGTPEGGAALAQMAGVTPGPVQQGRSFYRVEVPRKEFLAGIGDVLVLALAQAVVTPDPKATTKCVDCGCEDGQHWQFCGK